MAHHPEQHFDDMTWQPDADLDPWLQSDDMEPWAGPKASLSLTPPASGPTAAALVHTDFDQPRVDFESATCTQDIHGCLAHTNPTPQPAQGTQFPNYGNRRTVYDAGPSTSSLETYDDFNWLAANPDKLLWQSQSQGLLPIAEASYAVTPAFNPPLRQTALSQTYAGPVDNAYHTTADLMRSPYGHGDFGQVAPGPVFALPMQEACKNPFLVTNQIAAEAQPSNSASSASPVQVSHGSGVLLGAEGNRSVMVTGNVPLHPTLVSPLAQTLTTPEVTPETEIRNICPKCLYEVKSGFEIPTWFTSYKCGGGCYCTDDKRCYMLACFHEACNVGFHSQDEQKTHWFAVHAPDHGRVLPFGAKACDECRQEFGSDLQLSFHAKELQHSPYACKCNKKFSRLDVLERHLSKYTPGQPTYPCTHCKRHRGNNGFKRQEHLTQHLRNYHHMKVERNPFRGEWPVCTHLGCPQYRGPDFHKLNWVQRGDEKPFASQAEFTDHMRAVHDESKFPCDIPHCHRVGGKGYFREKDLINHRRTMHPDATPYVAAERQFCFPALSPTVLAMEKGVMQQGSTLVGI